MTDLSSRHLPEATIFAKFSLVSEAALLAAASDSQLRAHPIGISAAANCYVIWLARQASGISRRRFGQFAFLKVAYA